MWRRVSSLPALIGFALFFSLLTGHAIIVVSNAFLLQLYGGKGGPSKKHHANSSHVSKEAFQDFDERVTEAFRFFAENYSDKDAAVVCIVGGECYTAKQLADEVERRTPFGLRELESARRFAMEYADIGPDGIIRMIMGLPDDAPVPSRG